MLDINRRYIIIQIYLWLSVNEVFNFEPFSKYDWAVGQNGSYFGYSVQITENINHSVIIGAPKEIPTGAVFTCPFTNCRQLNQIKLAVNYSFNYLELPTDHALGFAVETFKTKLIACAPRWVNRKFKSFYFSNGVCYVHDLKTNETELLMPLINLSQQGYERNKVKYYYYSFGQAGFSIDIDKQGALTLGAPGVLNWLGTIVSYELNSTDKYTNPVVPNPLDFYEDIWGSEVPPTIEPEYFGYAIASGKYRDGDFMHVAGAPRSNNLTGQVSY